MDFWTAPRQCGTTRSLKVGEEESEVTGIVRGRDKGELHEDRWDMAQECGGGTMAHGGGAFSVGARKGRNPEHQSSLSPGLQSSSSGHFTWEGESPSFGLEMWDPSSGSVRERGGLRESMLLFGR